MDKNLFDLLLEEENIVDKKKDLEITRLSKKFNKKFIINIKSLTEAQIENCYDSKESKLDFILESVTIEGKSLKEKVLLDKFSVKIARDVIKKIFNHGEITWLYIEILKLNGLSGDAIVELKN
ncbi:hypothetical protein DP124_12055 [Clostridium tetani]|uniref:phage tail assembly chaperone n=1 Tax=Clostridium tetani TaxID=1513 RepID=UPI00100C2CB0|nr:hypothetical protein [Clostridium tetani]RXI50196.1 hypothetical protein DP124_12055 [Clostridium tetani]